MELFEECGSRRALRGHGFEDRLMVMVVMWEYKHRHRVRLAGHHGICRWRIVLVMSASISWLSPLVWASKIS